MEEFDFISNLPLEILNSILCSLTIKEAARTCILSKKWRYIWTSIPHLEFSERNALERSLGFLPGNTQQYSVIFHKWVAFVYRVLLFPRNPIESCHILADFGHGNVVHLDNIIAVLNEKGIQKLALSNTGEELHNIPSDIFFCQSLNYLELKQWELMRIPASFRCFDHLKVLHLYKVNTTDDLIEQLISSCVILERLIMNECGGIQELRIHALKLLSLSLFAFRPMHGRLWNVPRLEYASISLFNIYREHWVDGTVKLMEFFKQLDHVNSLDLYWNEQFAESLSRGYIPEHQFYNLKKLSVVVQWEYGNVDHFLSFLLGNSPHLKELQVSHCSWSSLKEPEAAPVDFWKKQHPFECVISSLERVQIEFSVNSTEKETDFVAFLLMNAVVLKSMTIKYYRKERMSIYLRRLERASPNAVLKLISCW